MVLDCGFELTRPTWGEEGFANGHIPGAQYPHLDRDLPAAQTATSRRHPLPAPEAFAALARRWGTNDTTQIVVHDGQELGFTVAVGVASFPHTAQTQAGLVDACESALAEAQRRGGNHVTLAAIRFEAH